MDVREYLFELRKKLNKTQSDIDSEIMKKYGKKVYYGIVEAGKMWKEISEEKANILADVLHTTPKYILQCEKTRGGFEGKHFRVGRKNAHSVRRVDDYSKPFTKEEKNLPKNIFCMPKRLLMF